MANQELVTAVKAIVGNARAGKMDAAYAGYKSLFASPTFAGCDLQEKRQALRLMIHAKGVPDPPTPAMIEAHKVAIPILVSLVTEHAEPADQEMLGMCHVVTGDEKAAGEVFRAALVTERERNAQSDLCGTLMKRVSML
ncbi:MAG TPA: hypothetical protein VHV30_03245 [Polyangiaceae bacterium]|jgi:hypothetical protein|nr:hypothetical protein [Polyangiaceae bacterium]